MPSLKEDLLCGEPPRQCRALLALLGLVASGRDAGGMISLVCHKILGNANIDPTVRSCAYDVALAAPLSESDAIAALEAALSECTAEADEVTPKALELIALYSDSPVLHREDVLDVFVKALASRHAEIGAAALEAVTSLVLAATKATLLPDLSTALIASLVATLSSKQCSPLRVAAACRCVTVLLSSSSSSSSIPPPPQPLATRMLEELNRHGGLALIRGASNRLPATSSCDAPPLVVAFMLQNTSQPDPLKATPTTGTQTLEHAVCLLDELLKTKGWYAPLVLSIATALLQLATLDETSSTRVREMVPYALSTLSSTLSASDHRTREVVKSSIVELLVQGVGRMAPSHQVTLMGRLPRLIATCPRGEDRVVCFTAMWNTALSADLVAARNGNSTMPHVVRILGDSEVKQSLSGGKKESSSTLSHPIVREELVGSLLHCTLFHDDGPRGCGPLAFNNTAASTLDHALERKAQKNREAWSEATRFILTGTKTCLGWDRHASVRSTGSTAIPDMWLQLLLACLQEDDGPELQGLLLQIAAHARSLHPGARPRAVFLCARYMRLMSLVDGAWTALADALRMVASDVKTRGAGGEYDGGAGLLSPGVSEPAGRYMAAAAGAAAESEEVVLASLEMLTDAVVDGAQQDKAACAPLAALLQGLLQFTAADLGVESGSNPPAEERISRCSRALAPIAASSTQQQSEPRVFQLQRRHPDNGGYPTTLSASQTLASLPESVRYRALVGQLDGASAPVESTNASWSAPVCVTGPCAPMHLAVRYRVDAGARRIVLELTATNKTTHPLGGASVSLGLGGPVRAESGSSFGGRVVKVLHSLDAGATRVWNVGLGVGGFGVPRVQPEIGLPGVDSNITCGGVAISPLLLLTPHPGALSAVEFFQTWQGLHHHSRVTGQIPNSAKHSVADVLSSIQGRGLALVESVWAPQEFDDDCGARGHACFYGAALTGECLALIVTWAATDVVFHFASDTKETLAHMCESQAGLVRQLTGGQVVWGGERSSGSKLPENEEDKRAAEHLALAQWQVLVHM